MNSQLSFNGWVFHRQIRLRPGLISLQYKHREENWTAEEVFAGVNNRPIGLLVKDSKGLLVGTVRSILELP